MAKESKEKEFKNVYTKSVKIEGDIWKNALDKAFNKKNKEVTIKGFRKGKAPRDMYIKTYGIESLYMEAVDGCMSEAYKKALDGLVPAAEPKVDIKAIDENSCEYEFTVITKPEVKVSSYKNLGVKKEEVKISKKEVEDEIIALQNRFAEVVIKENGDVEGGDIAVIDFEGFIDDVPFDGGKGTDYELEIGSATFIPGFEEQIIGQKKGETRDIKVTFPKDYTENLRNKDAVFRVTVKEIKVRVLPELNKDFFLDLNYDDVNTKEDLEKKIKEHLEEHAKADVENKYINDLIDAGINNMTVEINDEIVEEELHRMMHEFEDRLKSQGFTLDMYFKMANSTLEDFKKLSRPEAVKRIQSRYLLDYIIENEKLEATNEEIEKHAEEQAEKYGFAKEELIEMYGGIDYVKYDLLVHKAIKILEK